MAEQYEYNEFVPDVHFELIPIKMLVSNQTYQRPISIAHVGRTAQNFNIYQINPVKVFVVCGVIKSAVEDYESSVLKS